MKKIIFSIAILAIMSTSCKKNENQATVEVDDSELITKDNRPVPDFSKGILTEEILWYFGRVSAPSVSPDGKTLLYSVKYFDYRKNKGNAELYTVPVAGGTPTQVSSTPDDELQPIWLPDGKKIAFLYPDKDGLLQVFEANPNGSMRRQVTHAPSDVNGFSFSPDGKNILFTRNVKLDTTAIDRYPDLPKNTAKIYDDLMYRHWDAWADGTYAHLFIAPVNDTENAVELLKGERFHSPVPSSGGMEEAVWSPDGKKIAYCCKRATGKDFALSTNTDIFIYDLASQQTINITEGNQGYDMDPVWSPDGSKIAWWSMETPGFESDKKRLMIYDLKKDSSDYCTPDFDYNAESFVWSAKGDKVYFLSCVEATYQIYSFDLASRAIDTLTSGDHDYNSLALAGDKLIATMTRHDLPAEIFSIDLETKQTKQITFTNKDILDKIDMGKTEKRWVKTTDGKDMLVWVILPPKFDPNKKYPTLLYCEGGPQSPVSQFFSYRWCFKMMSAHGYIVVAPNRRGLPGFGQEWNDQISRDYGGQNMKDYFSAIDALAKEPYVDETRLGAVGASYGGYSVYWLAGHHEKRFKAFIAHCGMFNFESWYGTTEELFFANHDIEGPYWEKPTPKSYSFSPNKFVGNWDTPILVIHGGNDFRIPYTEGMQAFDIAQMKGIPSRFLYFPDETHFVVKPQNAMVWQREFFRFLDEYLKK